MSVIDELALQAYEETASLLSNPEMEEVVNDGLSILYGPPLYRPDLALVTFQGGGGVPIVQTTWPDRLLYLDDNEKFGAALRGLCHDAGLWSSLESSTVALPLVFPQAPTRDAGKWMRSYGPRAVWREHSASWVRRLIEAMSPKVVVVFGDKATKVLGMQWRDVERNHAQNHMTYARSQLFGVEAVFCHHLSQGYVKSEALRCLRVACEIIDGQNT